MFRGFIDIMLYILYFWLLEDIMLVFKGIWIKYKKSLVVIRCIEGSDCFYVDFFLNIVFVILLFKIVIDEYNKSIF